MQKSAGFPLWPDGEWETVRLIGQGSFGAVYEIRRQNHVVGLRSDGTVVAVGRDKEGQCSVSGWTDIVAVAAGGYHTVGLRSDGTVVATGRNDYGQCDLSDWTNIG